MIKECHENYQWNIALMCKIAGIKRKTYYKWLHTPTSQKELSDQRLTARIIAIAKSNNSLFGVGKMTMMLNKTAKPNEEKYGHNRIARLMSINGIKCQRAKYNKPWRAKHPSGNQTAENILHRNFNVDAPNQKWGTDITEVTAKGIGKKAYLATVIDLYDRFPVGYAISDRNDTILTQKAIDEAFNNYPDAHPIFHSDRGFQFTRQSFKDYLKEHQATQSMSRVGCCIDNGPVEGWQGHVKEMRQVLYPEVKDYNELVNSMKLTIKYYIEQDPQARFHGKTAGEIRAEAMKGNVQSYPIAPNPRIMKYKEELKRKQKTNSN